MSLALFSLVPALLVKFTNPFLGSGPNKDLASCTYTGDLALRRYKTNQDSKHTLKNKKYEKLHRILSGLQQNCDFHCSHLCYLY